MYQGRPVAFCHPVIETETLWDVSVETVAEYRGRGLAGRAARAMIRHMRAFGKSPVWGALESNGPLNARLGRNGREYFARHYAWPVIERKYLDMFAALKRGAPAAMEPLPGWMARRRRDVPPANEVLASIPSGAAILPPEGGSHEIERAGGALAARADAWLPPSGGRAKPA